MCDKNFSVCVWVEYSAEGVRTVRFYFTSTTPSFFFREKALRVLQQKLLDRVFDDYIHLSLSLGLPLKPRSIIVILSG